jgi:hypothetical protein
MFICLYSVWFIGPIVVKSLTRNIVGILPSSTIEPLTPLGCNRAVSVLLVRFPIG